MTFRIKSQVTAQAVQKTELTNLVLAERRKPSCQPLWSPAGGKLKKKTLFLSTLLWLS